MTAASPVEFVIASLVADPHVEADLKRHLTTPQAFLKSRNERHDKHRRFADQPDVVTGFDDPYAERTLNQRAVDYAEYVRELRDDCREIDERSAA